MNNLRTHIINQWLFFGLSFLLLGTNRLLAQLPEGFGTEYVIEDVESLAGIRFLSDSTSLVWTFAGEVLLVHDNDVEESSIIDIRNEVGQWGDHGMLGFAVHPDFNENGLIYLLYQVDTYHLLNSDSPDYDPSASQNYNASLGRLTRFQLNTSFPHEMLEGSRTELIGSEIDNGIPQMSASHGVGSVEFGSDKSLLVTCGDGSTWVGAFTGGPPYPEYAFDENGMDYGILSPEENIGSYRAQYIDSYNGKLLRIDPLTGLGLASNPFYDPDSPDSPRSKVWSLGFRNPFRMIVRPGTGSSDISAGDPGSVYVGDVGYYNWEEIDVANGPALNFGWPQYEGMNTFIGYDTALTYHPDYPNPLFSQGSCPYENYHFQDLIIQPNESHENYWGNPCDNLVPLADSLVRFVHERPALAYANQAVSQVNEVLIPGYNDAGNAVGFPAEDLGTVTGEPFTGIASVGGDFYYGTGFPQEYFGAYFQSDYSGWMRVFWFDENDRVVDYKHFTSDLGPILSTRFNPFDECLYVTSGFPTAISRICYAGNLRPNAVIEIDTLYGPSPLTVNFSAAQSWDPDEDPLIYHWDFGDGDESDQIEVQHTFTAPNNDPLGYSVILTVTDTAGNVDSEELIISLNNTPPQVNITSLVDSGLYSVVNITEGQLIAEVLDLEFEDEDLYYSWQTILHHNTHTHANPYDHAHETTTIFEPAGCEDYASYFYRVTLKVDDPAGLSGYDEVVLFPDCDSLIPPSIGFPDYVIYPNPNRGVFTIRGPFQPEERFLVEVFDTAGRIKYAEDRVVDGFGRIGFSESGLPNGYYLLRLTSESDSEVIRFHVLTD